MAENTVNLFRQILVSPKYGEIPPRVSILNLGKKNPERSLRSGQPT